MRKYTSSCNRSIYTLYNVCVCVCGVCVCVYVCVAVTKMAALGLVVVSQGQRHVSQEGPSLLTTNHLLSTTPLGALGRLFGREPLQLLRATLTCWTGCPSMANQPWHPTATQPRVVGRETGHLTHLRHHGLEHDPGCLLHLAPRPS